MSQSAPAQRPAENRRSRDRQRCLLSCKIVHGPWKESLDGIIRDLHADGARIRMREPAVIAGRLSLLVERSGQIHTCEVVWRKDGELGVTFQTGDLGTAEAQVDSLKRLAGQMNQSRRRAVDDGRY